MYNKIKIMELELSSACNSFCPGCPRYVTNEDTLELFKNHNVNPQAHLTEEQLVPVFENLEEGAMVEIIGTVGDPFANPNIYNIIKRLYEINPKVDLSIHTNGSLQKPEVYEKLARFMNRATGWKIVFSIDGLEDTNHLYRIGVSWNKIMDNVKAFISKHGLAYWKFIEFPHNINQIEQARAMAKDLGFASFSTRENQADNDFIARTVHNGESTLTIVNQNFNDSKYYGPIDKTLNKNKHLRWMPNFTGPMVPRCARAQYMHIRGDGKVFPCCHFAAQEHNVTEYFRQEIRNVMSMNDSNWNDLNHNHFNDIISHDNWKRVEQNFSSDDPCTACIFACDSGKQDRKNVAEIPE